MVMHLPHATVEDGLWSVFLSGNAKPIHPVNDPLLQYIPHSVGSYVYVYCSQKFTLLGPVKIIRRKVTSNSLWA